MKGSIVLAVVWMLAYGVSFGQTGRLSIPFLETLPVVDGLPDTGTKDWTWNEFQDIEKTNPENEAVDVRYKMAYNYTSLYILIESASDSLIYRDRAHQNGDGFHMVIAKPEKDTTSSEFYVLQFSPANKSKGVTARKGIWYYNIGLSGKLLSSATQFVCQSAAGKTYFELLLPWSEIHPYHPLFSEAIGINLCFVKAIGDKDKNYYFFKYDRRMQSELSRRKYIPVDFGVSPKHSLSFSQVKAGRSNIQAGDSIKIKVISVAETAGKQSYYFAVKSADNYTYSEIRKEWSLAEGINKFEFNLSSGALPPGGYKIYWKCLDSSEGEIPLSILPLINPEKEKTALDELKNNISRGDYHTLLFMLENLVGDYKKVKAYENAGSVRERFNTYHHYLEQLRNGNNLIANQKGTFRRAFLSKIDSTLQPYSIRLPENFERNGKKYPLFVMLHGSGSDDQNMLINNLGDNRCIEIAPFGRGTSNCFTTGGAEVDVKEAIDDAIRNYPVDTSKIIIAGFSMGGYGAYRIFYEYPRLFKAVAVFSGHPNLAAKWIGEGYPDFLNSSYLKPFKDIPVFIYHCKNDLNCPYDLTQQLNDKLIKAGAKVKFVISAESGHGILNKEQTPVYYKWLLGQVGQ